MPETLETENDKVSDNMVKKNNSIEYGDQENIMTTRCLAPQDKARAEQDKRTGSVSENCIYDFNKVLDPD